VIRNLLIEASWNANISAQGPIAVKIADLERGGFAGFRFIHCYLHPFYLLLRDMKETSGLLIWQLDAGGIQVSRLNE
jgi:hypothetical protein